MRSLLRAREENHKDGSQVNQARFSDVRCDELGRCLDGSQQQCEVTSRDRSEAELVCKDMAIVGKEGMPE